MQQLDIFLDYKVPDETDGIRFEIKGNTVKAIGPFFDSPYMTISELETAQEKLLKSPEPQGVLKRLKDYFLDVLERQQNFLKKEE